MNKIAKKEGSAAKGATLLVFGKAISRAMDFALLLIMARLLSPSDFGLVALALPIVVILQTILELPINSAMLRARHLTRGLYSTAFTLGILRALILFLAVALIAIPLTHFYAEPRLLILLLVLAAAPMSRSLMNPRLIYFAKKLEFKPAFTVDVIGKLASLIAAAGTAFVYESYWAIVVATITAPLVSSSLSYLYAPFRPTLTLKNWSFFQDIIGWGTITQLFNVINWQLPRLILGAYIPPALFGQFSIGSQISEIPHQAISVPLTSPMMSSLAKSLTNGRLIETYVTQTSFLVILIAPIYVFMSVRAPELVEVLLGSQWKNAAPMISVLAVVMLINTGNALLPSLALLTNKNKFTSIYNGAPLILFAPAIFISAKYFGISVLLQAMLILSIIKLFWGWLVYVQISGGSIRLMVVSLIPGFVSVSASYAMIGFLPVPQGSLLRIFFWLTAEGAFIALSIFAISFVVWIALHQPISGVSYIYNFFQMLVRKHKR